jgi:hypothetical protein
MVNSLLQESRNVTWRLQNEKRAVPEFDSWYESWVQRMKDNDVMAWAESMRTHVVHKGDFEAKSVARVSVLAAWDSPAPREISVPPLLNPHVIAEIVRRRFPIPPELVKDAVAIVERRWVVESLPDRDVLEALADCYLLLYELVADAHSRVGLDMTEDSIEAIRPTWPKGESRRDRPSVMVLSQEVRTSRIQVASGISISVERHFLEPTDADMRKAEQRWAGTYGGMPPGHPGKIPETSDELFALAEWHVEAAKRVLAGDGYHDWYVFTFGPDGVTPELMRPEDRTDKFLLWDRLAERIRRRGDWGLISVAEAWLARAEPRDLDRPVDISTRPGRREALLLMAAHRDGKARSYTVAFARSADGGFDFEKTWQGFAPDEAMNVLIPVMKVWRAWRQTHAGQTGEALFVDSRS